jgi:hypothetical protein
MAAGLGFKDFVTGEVLTAADVDGYLMQGIWVFDDATARDAAVTSPQEGNACYLKNTNEVLTYSGSAWVAVGGGSGMTLISATTIGSAVASVTVTGAFSATYDNYKIIITGGSASADNFFQLTLGATTTGYYYAGQFVTYANSASTAAGSNAAFYFAGNGQSSGLQTDIDVYNPFLSDETAFISRFAQLRTGGSSGYVAGYLNNTTSYTAFTITPSTGTLTGGTIRVYGLKNS